MASFLDTSDPALLARAVEENGADFLLELGRAGGGEERDDGGVHWTIGGSPIDYHNAVVAAVLTPETADAAIASSLATLRGRGVHGTWHVGPSMSPADLGKRLEAHGYFYAGDDIGMAADLALLAQVETPPGFFIDRVAGEADLNSWVQTLGQGFGEGPSEARWVGDMYARLGLGNPNWRHYLGRLDGDAVATATMFLGAGVAGIYFVFTVEGARKKGIGAAMTVAPLLDARAEGFRIGVLGASSMGEPVYRRIGFREYCQIGLYEWQQS